MPIAATPRFCHGAYLLRIVRVGINSTSYEGQRQVKLTVIRIQLLRNAARPPRGAIHVPHRFRRQVVFGNSSLVLDYTGETCDFAQLGRNLVALGARITYHAQAMIYNRPFAPSETKSWE